MTSTKRISNRASGSGTNVGVKGSKKDAHLARRRLDLDFVWRDQLRLKLAAPFDGALDALPCFVKLPLGSTQIAREGVRLVQPPAFPWRI